MDPLIERAAAEAGTAMYELPEAERAVLIAAVRARYGLSLPSSNAWDVGSAPDGVRDPDAATRIAAYVGDRPCLFIPDRAQSIWRLPDGAALLHAIEKSSPIELYVCDEALSYLLCHNDHDYLIGWGEAQAYVQSRLPGNS
jgi:hypothetical protein